MTEPFRLERLVTSPGRFHALDLLAAPAPLVVECAATAAALVLGSGQPPGVADVEACARAGVEVVRRRSGGGAVLVEPGAMTWFDVVVPAGDPRFAAVSGDVTASMVWLGGHVAAALAGLGVDGATVYEGRLQATTWSRQVCFAGLGPGEVSVGGAKLVGVSQRRRRAGARFQCMVHTAWRPAALVALLARPRPEAGQLPPVATVPAATAAALPAAVAVALSAGR